MTPASKAFCGLAIAMFAALVAVEIYGFRNHRLFSQDIWEPVGWHRFMAYAKVFLGLAVAALVFVPRAFNAIVLGLVLVLTVVSAGPMALLAVAFFVISAGALGTRLLGWKNADSLETQICAILLGAGVYIFLMTFLARLPVNYPAVWGIVLAVPVAIDWRGVRIRLAEWAGALRRPALRPWERAAWALLIFILVAHWLVVLTPEDGYDALAVHLAVPMNIAAHHRMTYQPERFLWAVIPMGADWTYSIVYLFGGEYAARLLNFGMLLAAVGLLYRAMRRWVSPAAASLLAASFAATPMVQLATGSLFVENLVAALVLGILTAIWRLGETGDKRFLYLAAGLGGTAMATKLGAVAFVAMALPFAMVEVVRRWKALGRRPWATCALALVLLLAAGLPAYAIAYYRTHDPVFPYQNRTFHSTIVDPRVSFDDLRFRIPLDWRTLYTLTFHSSATYEGQDGSFGFQYLIVIPLALAGLLVVRGRPAQSAAVVAWGVGLVVMSSQPNARYLYATLPVFLVPFSALLGWMRSHLRWMYWALLAFVVLCAALDTYFLPASGFYHKEFCLSKPFSRVERERYMEFEAPIRGVIAYFDRHHAGSPVLLTGQSMIAGLEGEIYMNHWHQYPTMDALRQPATLARMSRLLESWNVGYFISPLPEPGQYAQPQLLRDFLNACTVPEYEFGDFYLARRDGDCGGRGWVPRVAAEPPLVLPPGLYDDFNPAIVLRGDWTRDDSFEQSDRRTISYSESAGAEIRFAFEGRALTYVFTKAPNRGIASVTIDGIAKDPIDLYSPNVEWHTEWRFCCMAPGRHLVVISVTGRKNPQSSGAFVDLDSFLVE